MTWMPAPRAIPNRCLITRQNSEGPYWESDLRYFGAHRGPDGKLKLASPQLQTLYISAAGLTAILNEPGSPVKAVDLDVWQDTLEALTEAEGELSAANDRVAELEAKLSEYQDRPEMPSAEDIAVLVAERVTGGLGDFKPKPKRQASK